MLVSGFGSWSQNLASLQVNVVITNKVEQNDGIPSSSAL